jgi:hypothetical protein
MRRSSKKGDALALTINPAALAEAVAEKLFTKIEAKYGKRLARNQETPAVERSVFSIPEFAVKAGMSPWFIRKEIREGRLPAIKVGDLTKIQASVAEQYLASRPAARPGDGGHRKPPPPRGAMEAATPRAPSTAPAASSSTAPRPPKVEAVS